jgi:hypothetical protein
MGANLHADRIHPRPRATPVAKPIRGCVLVPKRPRFLPVCGEVRESVAPPTRESRPIARSGSPDGETRTRTGDTTIFSHYVPAAERHEIPGNERFLRVDLAPLIFAIAPDSTRFRGWPASHPRFGRAVCSGGEPEVAGLVRRPDPHWSERRCRFGRGARSSSRAGVMPVTLRRSHSPEGEAMCAEEASRLRDAAMSSARRAGPNPTGLDRRPPAIHESPTPT